MSLRRLSRLQSRLLAFVLVNALLVIAYWLFTPTNFADAAELHSSPGDSLVGLEFLRRGEEEGGEGNADEDGGYVGDFKYFDRSLTGRAVEGVEGLEDGKVREVETLAGRVTHFVLERGTTAKRRRNLGVEEERRGVNGSEGEEVDEEEEDEEEEGLERRQNRNQVFVSVSSCRQPDATTRLRFEDPPQLSLYVSASDRNQQPGPGNEEGLVGGKAIPLVGGYANLSISTTNNVYIGVSAPNLTEGWQGGWQFEVAASTKGFYHSYNQNETFLFLIDTDSDSALFVSKNLTSNNDSATIDAWRDLTDSPFTMFAFNDTEWGARGLERSVCGLKSVFNTSNNYTVDNRITTKFGGGSPKALFHVQNLTADTSYRGYLVVDTDMTTSNLDFSATAPLGAGGRVWQQFIFTTKKDDSCQVIFDLPFCTNTAYAVPSSRKFKSDDAALISIYDAKAAAYYTNFTKSLSQIACETTGSAQYSLARNCTDCASDYKDWLCTALIPRCEDWSAKGDALQMRNVNSPFLDGSPPPSDFVSSTFALNRSSPDFNATIGERAAFAKSRHAFIDEEIQPGPHKEILPCEDLCFALVRSCPAQLQFACPIEPARSLAYGRRQDNTDTEIVCNFPGAIRSLNLRRSAAVGRVRGGWWMVGVVVGVGVWLGL
ncbi:hypothetical protein BU24DRAFT_451109 [Aaosphaeria arxii CBS 175.79]|uniref:FZ domain-containing protein n=1 Tax=Aaosphaeria arxii CBS 175.79 TaxID=1450172 RepID=A0A6A5XUY1_9PLEO|nr:uncharacterized protein BU24DRAFT_451109 [Aaosphaeria arxii CBS 175.79]KAF2016617.1 hypothetical protein BU24DRAFT_451109 [Aaosphaeria arxii CBS 175.79]